MTVFTVKRDAIRIPKEELEEDPSILDKYIDMMNGIAYICLVHNGFRVGYRNQVAVDLTVGSYMLGLDALEVVEKFIDFNLIDPDEDDEETMGRVETILRYSDRFSWGWMIDPDAYLNLDPLKPFLMFELA